MMVCFLRVGLLWGGATEGELSAPGYAPEAV